MELPGIRGKVAIVTGAGGGIGEAYAKGLAGQGARVVVAEIDRERGERVAGEIGASGGAAMALAVDVASPESTRAMAEQTAARFGGIDFLVNNAAIHYDPAARAVTADLGVVTEALDALTRQYDDLRRHLYGEGGRLRSFVNVYVNQEDIRDLQKDQTPINDGDTITIVPSIAGGWDR